MSEYVYCYTRVFTVGFLILCVSVILVVCALIVSTQEYETITSPKTLDEMSWHIANYQVHPNGTKYYEYQGAEGKLIRKNLATWFDKLLQNEFTFQFGGQSSNYCNWPPNSTALPYPSLFRATQLRALVQVLLRICILCSMTIRILQHTLTTFFDLSNSSPSPRSKHYLATEFISSVSVVNEIFYSLGLFGSTNFHFWQDRHYTYLMPMSVRLLYLTFAVKMISTATIKGSSWCSALRLFLAMVTLPCLDSALANLQKYISLPLCDQFVPLEEAWIEWLMTSCILIAYAMDVYDTRNYEIFVISEILEETEWSRQMWTQNLSLNHCIQVFPKDSEDVTLESDATTTPPRPRVQIVVA